MDDHLNDGTSAADPLATSSLRLVDELVLDNIISTFGARHSVRMLRAFLGQLDRVRAGVGLAIDDGELDLACAGIDRLIVTSTRLGLSALETLATALRGNLVGAQIGMANAQLRAFAVLQRETHTWLIGWFGARGVRWTLDAEPQTL